MYPLTHPAPHFVVHDIIVGLAGAVALKGRGLVEQLVGYDSQRPPVTAHTIVCDLVQAGEHLRGNVFWSAHWKL